MKLYPVLRTNGVSVFVYGVDPSGINCAALLPNKAEASLMVGQNPMGLSSADGALVAASICAVWLAAWAIRQWREVMKDEPEEV